MCMLTRPGLGWQPDLPDPRDYAPGDPEIRDALQQLAAPSVAAHNPPQVDLRDYFAAVTDQGSLNSSTAHACVAQVNYFQGRVYGSTQERSTKFVYKNARRLRHVTGDVGSEIRVTLKALVRFGLPPAEHVPDEHGDCDQEMDPFLYQFADELSAMKYVRLDSRNLSGVDTLQRVKAFLAAGFPSVFGFSVPRSLSADPDFPYRPSFDGLHGGVAAVAAGYDDRRIRATTKGALLIRTSWGQKWGEEGYGWLPYAYVEEQIASDFWIILKEDWLASDEFTRPPIFE